jgi:hypothetical protein
LLTFGTGGAAGARAAALVALVAFGSGGMVAFAGRPGLRFSIGAATTVERFDVAVFVAVAG